jgi:hypothetical protein
MQHEGWRSLNRKFFINAMTRCSHKGCSAGDFKGGVCWRHGAKDEMKDARQDGHEGCTFYSKMGGVCVTRNNEESMPMKRESNEWCQIPIHR